VQLNYGDEIYLERLRPRISRFSFDKYYAGFICRLAIEKRVTIAFCLIRQSSANPFVGFHQSNQIPAHHSIGMSSFMVMPWTNERRVGSSRRSCFPLNLINGYTGLLDYRASDHSPYRYEFEDYGVFNREP
jgi:hypothetical protein